MHSYYHHFSYKNVLEMKKYVYSIRQQNRILQTGTLRGRPSAPALLKLPKDENQEERSYAKIAPATHISAYLRNAFNPYTPKRPFLDNLKNLTYSKLLKACEEIQNQEASD